MTEGKENGNSSDFFYARLFFFFFFFVLFELQGARLQLLNSQIKLLGINLKKEKAPDLRFLFVCSLYTHCTSYSQMSKKLQKAGVGM